MNPSGDIILQARWSILKRVVVVGYYGYGNMGDEMLFEVAREILKDMGFEITALYPKSGDMGDVKLIGRYDLFSLIRELSRSKALIFGGGGIFQDETSVRSMVYYTFVAKLAHFMGKRVILFGNGVGPLKSRMSRLLFKWVVLSNKTVVFPRDPISERYIRTLKKKVYPGTDLAVLYLERFKANGERGRKAVIVPKKLGDWDEIAEFLTSEGYEVVFLAVSPKESEIVRKYLGRYKVKEGDPINVITNSQLVLSERFHPCLVAAFFGIPFVSIGEPKTERFFRKLLKKYPGFSSKSKEDIMIKIKKVENESVDLREELLEKAEKMVEKFRKILLNL